MTEYSCRGSSFFFNDTATTEIYTLSLHDALPILCVCVLFKGEEIRCVCVKCVCARSEEHTSELQSHLNLVCRLLLDKKSVRYTQCSYYSVRVYCVRAEPRL